MDLAVQISAVVLVLGVLLVAARYLRGGQLSLGSRANDKLAAAGRIQLTPQHGVHIIQFGNRRLLVATFPSGCSVIDSEPIEEQSK